MSRRQLRVGDVFTLPINEEALGVGQVVGLHGNDAYFFAVFADPAPPDLSADDLVSRATGPVLFLALSFDALVHVGEWKVVGSAAVDHDIPLPAYKEEVGTRGDFHVVDHSGQRRRPATADEVQQLSYRKLVAPIRVGRALRASHGLEPWLDAFDSLRVDEKSAEKRFFD